MSSFVGTGAEVAEAGVQPAGVVPAFDVLEDRRMRGGPRRPAAPVDQFCFDGREKRLGDSVVPALSLASHRQTDAVVVGEITGLGGGVLLGQPRSEWKITPDSGRRWATALFSASAMRSVRR